MCRGDMNPHEYYMKHSFHTSVDDIDRAAYSQITALWGGGVHLQNKIFIAAKSFTSL